MKINLTSTVSELKSSIRKKYNIEVEIFTLKGNVAGANRKLRALMQANNKPFSFDEDLNGSDFISLLVNDFGMSIHVVDADKDAEVDQEEDAFNTIFSKSPSVASNILVKRIRALYANEDQASLEELMKRIINKVEDEGIYYWIFYAAKAMIYDCNRTSESDFDYTFDGECDRFKMSLYTIQFDPKPARIGPFMSGSDFNWQSEGQESFFESLALHKMNMKEEDLDQQEKFTTARHGAMTILLCSLISWINSQEVSSADLSNCFLSVMDPKDQSENLRQLSGDLPSLICSSIAFIDLADYNSEEDDSNKPFGDYVHDWVQISDRILSEDTFFSEA
ncbi:MAG: hypothetical protein ACKO6L_06970 [Flavobacteriales bacterium]